MPVPAYSVPELSSEDIRRFWAKVQFSDRCWVWIGYREPRGYGRFTVGRRSVLAHRIAWALANGDQPEGGLVLHRCDNPPCVNPGHLYLGTDTENMADRDRRGRTAKGIRNGRAKITPEMVRSIRAEYAAGGTRQIDLAAKYGVAWQTIGAITSGRNWRWVA